MKRQATFYTALLVLLTFLASCKEDIGPYEEVTRTYSLADFNKLAMGSGFQVDVRFGNIYQVEVRGNRTDVDDLDVNVRSSTLNAQYRNYNRKQRYKTVFTVTMPTVRAVDFSGAVKSTIVGFTNLNELDVKLSGASKAAVSVNAARVSHDLSGASQLIITGNGTRLSGGLSGASTLDAYEFPVNQAELDVSGASNARVQVTDALNVKASGASKVRYRGSARVNSEVSGASTVSRD
ncbi:head GIN domain-containing protein [Spirosoma fluminis]